MSTAQGQRRGVVRGGVTDTMQEQATAAGSVELRDYLTPLRRQLALVLAVTLLGGAAAAAYTFRRTPVYESTSSVLVRAITANAFDPGMRVDQQLNMFNQRQIAQSQPVATLAARTLGGAATPAQLLEHVSVDVPANSQILRVHYRDTVPLTAQRGADAFAKAYLDFRRRDAELQARTSQAGLQNDLRKLTAELNQAQRTAANPRASATARGAAAAKAQSLNNRIENLQDQIQTFTGLDFTPGTVIAPADLPIRPATPNHKLDIGIGLLIGLFLAVALAFLRDRTDGRLRGREELAERLDRPVLATIPPLPAGPREAGRRRWTRRRRDTLVTLEQPNSPAAESFRTLRTRIARLAGQLDIKSVMVVSAAAGEGKSTIAANLAVVLAETGKDVLLISADLRRPRVHQLFGLPNESGLSDVLTGGTGTKATQPAAHLWSVAPHLGVLPSGPMPPRPSALMDSDAMRRFLKEQRDLFDFILLDCPPALVVADALALAPLADAVLVVADAKLSDRAGVSRLKEELEQVGGSLVGAVLNRSKRPSTNAYYYDER
jgi:polysaccharide biosynthesis transport protein